MALLDPILYMPPLLVLIGVIYLLGSGQPALLLGITLLNIPFTVRYVRALADPVFDSGYVEVAFAAGDALVLILWREVLPVTESVDWAGMVRDGLPGLMLNPWACLLPALCIVVVVQVVSFHSERWSQS